MIIMSKRTPTLERGVDDKAPDTLKSYELKMDAEERVINHLAFAFAFAPMRAEERVDLNLG